MSKVKIVLVDSPPQIKNGKNVGTGHKDFQIQWADSGTPVGVGLFASDKVAIEFARTKRWTVVS